MSMKNIGMNLSKAVGPVALKVAKASPKIFLIAGVIGLTSAGVMACRVTYLKLDKIKRSHDDEREEVEEMWEDVTLGKEGKPKDNRDYRKDVTMVYIRTAADLIKAYGPSIALGALSIGLCAGSHTIMSKRNIALAAGYKAVQEAMDALYSRVVEEHGEEKAYMYRHGLGKVDVEETDEKGKTKKSKKFVTRGPLTGHARWYCEYDVLTGEGSTEWSPDHNYNEMVLRRREKYWNDILAIRRYVLFSEVLQNLGLKLTDESIGLGWVKGDEISFGIDKQLRPRNERDDAWLLEFAGLKTIIGMIDELNKR